MSLTAAVKTYKTRLAAAIAERYAPRLKSGETLPDFTLPLELAVRDVQVALAHLIELDDEVDYAWVEHHFLKQDRRDLVRQQLHPRAVAVRGAIDLAFGRERGAYLHGMKGRTRRRPENLQNQLRRTIHRLTDPNRKLPTPRNTHVFIDRQGWTRQLETHYQKLVELNQRVGLGDHAFQALVAKKQRAMAAFDEAYADALSCVIAGMRMARFGKVLIKKLKPYYLRRQLSAQARKKRETRALAATGAPVAGTEEAPQENLSIKEAKRVTVPKAVAIWLEQSKLFGT